MHFVYNIYLPCGIVIQSNCIVKSLNLLTHGVRMKSIPNLEPNKDFLKYVIATYKYEKGVFCRIPEITMKCSKTRFRVLHLQNSHRKTKQSFVRICPVDCLWLFS